MFTAFQHNSVFLIIKIERIDYRMKTLCNLNSLLIILFVLTVMVHNQIFSAECTHTSQNLCGINQCSHYFWNYDTKNCSQCQENQPNCHQCPRWYDLKNKKCNETIQCYNTTNQTLCSNCLEFYFDVDLKVCQPCHQAKTKQNCNGCVNFTFNAQNSSCSRLQTIQINEKCLGKNITLCQSIDCRDYIFDNVTSNCLECQKVDQNLCKNCLGYIYNNETKKCNRCKFNLTNCTGCRYDKHQFCQSGCPPRFISNGTRCVPKAVVNVNLTINPSNLISDWKEQNKGNQQQKIDSNKQIIVKSLLTLTGLTNQSTRMIVNSLSSGSIIANLSIVPAPQERLEQTLSSIQTNVKNNQKAANIQVIQSSFVISSQNDQSKNKQQSKIGIIIGISIGVLLICGLVIGFVCYKKKNKNKEYIDKAETKTVSTKDIITDKECVKKDNQIMLESQFEYMPDQHNL